MKKTRDGVFYSLTDVAKATGLDINAVWCFAYRTKAIPLPPIQHGRRMWYDATGFKEAVALAKTKAQ